MTPSNLFKRYFLFIAGLFIMSFGIAFSIKADLGTSPISSLPYVISLILPLSVGTATIAMHCVLILLQILILRKKFHLVQLMQLPVALIFGYLIDFAVWATDWMTYTAYWQQWLICFLGILLVAIGVSIEFTANVVVLAGEGVVLAVCQVTRLKPSNMKVIFDVTLVSTALVLLLLFVHHLDGVREGTIAAAIFVGMLTKKINPVLQKLEKKYLMN